MEKSRRNGALAAGGLVAVFSFVLLYCGVALVLRNEVLPLNVAVWLVFSALCGLAAGGFFAVRLWWAFSFFTAGLAAGFIHMYISFSRDPSGWGDLTGLMSLFFWALAGLAAGLVAELIVLLVRRARR